MVEKEYPSNTYSTKKGIGTERPKLKKVTTGPVRVKEKTAGDNIVGTVWGKWVKPALIFAGVSIIIPAVKDMAEDAITGMIRGAFNGGDYSRSGNRGRNGKSPFVNYTTIGQEAKTAPRTLSAHARATHDFNELILDTREEGDYILEQLNILVDQYGHAKVSDMYSLAGITGSFPDDKWGWFDLAGAGVRRHSGGYLLAMPKTQPID